MLLTNQIAITKITTMNVMVKGTFFIYFRVYSCSIFPQSPIIQKKNSAFKFHNNIKTKLFKPTILINPYCNKTNEEDDDPNGDLYQNKIFSIEKIRKNGGTKRLRGAFIRNKRKEKYKMFDSNLKEECINMVI